MPTIADSLISLSTLPGVAEATDAARQACTTLRWHQALRRRIPEAAAESRVRGARASAVLDGAEMDLDLVRDLMRGATAWPETPDPLEEVVQGAARVTAETENIASMVISAPSQALARVHTAAAGHLLPESQIGRPRQVGEISREFTDLGPAPDETVVRQRLSGIVELLLNARDAPALVVAALVHAEIATVRPFVRGNGLVARAMERAVIQASGLDPTGVAVVELGHGAGGGAAYLGALAAYGSGTPQGVALWLTHCAQAVVAGAGEGGRIADAVLVGRLT
ncbi:MAG: Fic family protein [Dermatophilaceae bacterium]|nr:Fic family protein [Dermatophilaceae bacterium]